MKMEARYATLADLAALLQEQHTRKLDVVAPAATVRSEGALIRINGTDAVLTDDGVTVSDGVYRPTKIADEGIAEKLGVPITYLRKLRESRPDLYDANVNGWLHGHSSGRYEGVEQIEAVSYPADGRSFLARCFRGDDETEGVLRAFLSDSYGIVDHLDVLTAGLDGIRNAGVGVEIVQCDLTERRMYVTVACPEVEVLAPTLLEGYRSPWGGTNPAPWDTETGRAHGWLAPDERPVVFAGFVLSNSETGDGAFTLTPRIVVKVCRNGLTVKQDALRHIHLGARMDEGVIRWSEATQRRNLELVTAQAADAVKTFLDVEYVQRVVARLEAKAGKPVADAAATVTHVASQLRFPKDRAALILDHFVRGGQMTAGGVMQAVTSAAQTVGADEQFEMEGEAIRALELAAAV